MVSRVDFSTNIITDYTPTIYYPYLGQLSNFKRLVNPESIYYNQKAKKLLFYDKIKEAKHKKMDMPVQYFGKNLLRYELVLNRDVARFLKYNGLYAKDLCSEELFKKLLHIWYGYYQQIQKHSKKLNPLEDKIINPSTFKNEMYNALVRKNPDEFYKMVAELKAKKKFKHPEYYSRINAEIRKIQKTEVVENPLIDELTKKIEEIYLELI
jgi:hypothetical protein